MRNALLVLAVAARALAQPPDDAVRQDVRKLMGLAEAVHAYAGAHEGQMPPDLASILNLVKGERSTAQAIKDTFIAPGLPAPKVPDDAKPDWVNANSSYAYTGAAGVEINDVPQWSELVVAHLK